MPQKRRGRPVTDNPKNLRVDVRLTPEELELLDGYCQEQGCVTTTGPAGWNQSPSCRQKIRKAMPVGERITPLSPTVTCKAAA